MADIEIGETPVRDIEEADKVIARDESGNIVRINATSLSSIAVLTSISGTTNVNNIDVITSVENTNGTSTSLPNPLEAVTVVGNDVYVIADDQKLIRYSSNPDDSLNYISGVSTNLGNTLEKGLAYNFTAGEMYVSEGETVYSIDIDTGVLTPIITNPLSGVGIGDICCYRDELHILPESSGLVVVYSTETLEKTREYAIGITGSDRAPGLDRSSPRSFWIGDEGAILASPAMSPQQFSSNIFMFDGEFESVSDYTILSSGTDVYNRASVLAPSKNSIYWNLSDDLRARQIGNAAMSKLSNNDMGLLAEAGDELIIDGNSATVHRVIDADTNIVDSVLAEPSISGKIERVTKNGDKLEVVDASRVLLAFRTP